MTSQATFRLSTLALMVGTLSMGMNGHAVYNLYKKDGLSLDINGQFDIQATKQDYEQVVLNDPDGFDFFRGNTGPGRSNIVAPYTVRSTDKKPRLGQTQGVSFVEFRGSQELPNDWRVTGQLGLGYSDARDMYLNNTSLSFDKKNVGAITIGRQYLHTNYVNRSGTDTPLDIFSQSAVRLDYYGMKGLHASAYYSFAEVDDVRRNSNTGDESGFGASVSYRLPVADNHSLRLAAGYTQNKANPAFTPLVSSTNFDYGWADNALNRYAERTQGVAVSAEYQVGPFLIAADAGRKVENMDKRSYTVEQGYTPLDKRTSDYLGAKVAYDINPVFQVSAGYGVKNSDTKLKAGATPLNTNVNSLSGNPEYYSYVDGDETYLFDESKTTETYVQADYRIRPNVRLYTRYDREKTTYEVASTTTNQVTDNNVRVGVVFNF